MKRITAIITALALTGCATTQHPPGAFEGVPQPPPTQAEVDAGAGLLLGVLGAAAAGAALGAMYRYDARTPYMRVERCSSRYGCSTTRYYRRGW